MIVMKKFLFVQIPRTEAMENTQGHMGKHQCQLGGRGSEGEIWARAFIGIFVGRNEWDKVNKLMIDQFK